MSKVINIQERQRKLKDGRVSIYLDYHVNGKRKYKTIDTKLEKNQSNLRIVNKEIKETTARIISMYDETINFLDMDIDFVEILKDDLENYDKKGLRNFKAAINKFSKFIQLDGTDIVLCKNLNDRFFLRFKKYLEDKLSPETARKYFRFIKNTAISCYEDGFVADNPFHIHSNSDKNKWHFKVDKNRKNKDVLTRDELILLIQTPCKNETVKNAFIFGCYTGLGFEEMRLLEWNDINLETKTLSHKRAKNNRKLDIPLHKCVTDMLDKLDKTTNLIFDLPSLTTVNITLAKLVKDAGINKSITSYCCRHTLATLLLESNVNIATVSRIMGHANIESTRKYYNWIAQPKIEAINSLPSINNK